jgi:hypothetical protein
VKRLVPLNPLPRYRSAFRASLSLDRRSSDATSHAKLRAKRPARLRRYQYLKYRSLRSRLLGFHSGFLLSLIRALSNHPTKLRHRRQFTRDTSRKTYCAKLPPRRNTGSTIRRLNSIARRFRTFPHRRRVRESQSHLPWTSLSLGSRLALRTTRRHGDQHFLLGLRDTEARESAASRNCCIAWAFRATWCVTLKS